MSMKNKSSLPSKIVSEQFAQGVALEFPDAGLLGKTSFKTQPNGRSSKKKKTLGGEGGRAATKSRPLTKCLVT